MNLDSAVNVKSYVNKVAIDIGSGEMVVENLSSGVSNEVWKVKRENTCWVVKQALEKLRVKEDWYSDVERIHREHSAIDALQNLVPGDSLPKILHVDYQNHIFIMTCAEGTQTWKELLMRKDFSSNVAENAGSLLRKIHQNSHKINDDIKRQFQDQKYFIQLRVDPFHRFLSERFPELTPSIQKLIDEVTLQKSCLIHGDFSPKNMLVHKDQHITLIDFEVAHWGNPVFDVAYCIGHLMLKSWYLNEPEKGFKLIDFFSKTYALPLKNLLPHLGLMLLARIDGKSPVNYIVDENLKNIIRQRGIRWINGEEEETNVLIAIKNALQIKSRTYNGKN